MATSSHQGISQLSQELIDELIDRTIHFNALLSRLPGVSLAM
jgi:hypothetical protein